METKSNHRYCSCCGNPIETQSKECPNCGRIYRKSKAGLVILFALLGVVVLSVGAYFALKLIPIKQPIALSAEEIYQLASPATVEIRVETEYGTATGTGFFDSAEGSIITNFHVLEDATSGSVYLSNGERYDILKLVGFDRRLDIAIIQIDYQPTSILQARTDLLQTGETVYALGSSVGLSDSFSQGIISANQREIGGQIFIQTTAPISHGNSGGPLIDKYGKVIGITTAGIETGQNLNLAVPIANIYKLDRNYPIGFPGNLSSIEQSNLQKANASYWNWIDELKDPLIICDTEEKKYHNGGCFVVNLVEYREENDSTAANADEFIYLRLSEALSSGYSQCPNCKQDNAAE